MIDYHNVIPKLTSRQFLSMDYVERKAWIRTVVGQYQAQEQWTKQQVMAVMSSTQLITEVVRRCNVLKYRPDNPMTNYSLYALAHAIRYDSDAGIIASKAQNDFVINNNCIPDIGRIVNQLVDLKDFIKMRGSKLRAANDAERLVS